MFLWLFWIALLGAFAVFIDPAIVAGILAVYIVWTIAEIIATFVIFALVIGTATFFVLCAIRGHPDWLHHIGSVYTKHVVPRFPWLPAYVDKVGKYQQHEYIAPGIRWFWLVRDRCLAAIAWEDAFQGAYSLMYEKFRRPRLSMQSKKLE